MTQKVRFGRGLFSPPGFVTRIFVRIRQHVLKWEIWRIPSQVLYDLSLLPWLHSATGCFYGRIIINSFSESFAV